MTQALYPGGHDIVEMIRAAKAKPFGLKAFYPWPGLGGHCIRLDLLYMACKAKQLPPSHPLSESTGEISRHAFYLSSTRRLIAPATAKVSPGLQGPDARPPYKKAIDNMREPPSVVIIEWPGDRGESFSATVSFCAGRAWPLLQASKRKHAALECAQSKTQ
jgi:UDP-N-acetyl-D-glucosamine dehydrogenase